MRRQPPEDEQGGIGQTHAPRDRVQDRDRNQDG